MIYVDKNTRIPAVEETLAILNTHNSMLPQLVDFDKVMMNINYLQFEIEKVGRPLFDVIGKPRKAFLDSNMASWLVRNDRTDDFIFTKTGLSLNKESIKQAVDAGNLKPETVDLLKVYQKYDSMVRLRGSLVGLLQNPISNVPSCDGHRMLILHPTWWPQNTGRVAMHDPAVQNFQRVLQEIVTVPQGYVKIHTDSGQIEPRIVYSVYLPDKQIQSLIRLYDDAYYGLLHYVTMPESDIHSGTTSFTAMEITDEIASGRKSIKTYGNAVMYGSKSNPTGDVIKAAMIKRIGNHPLRTTWTQELMRKVSMGETVFTTAFGTKIDTGMSVKFTESGAHAENIEEQRLRLAINNPIQGTAADLMRLSVSEANKILMNKAKNSFIIHYVHDSGVFAVHEDDYDKVSDELKDIVAYSVEGWLPIKAEPDEGRNGGKDGLIEDLY